MTTGDKIKSTREDMDILQQELADAIEMNVSVLSRIEKGTRPVRDDELKKIAQKLGVSTDYLLGVHPPQKNSLPSLNAKDEREITRMMDDMKDRLMQEEGLMFDGQPASPESIQSILDAMQIGMEMAKKRNKAKYTPKKYRPEG